MACAFALIASASGPLRGECRLPGDKSIGHRAAILGALADGASRFEGFPEGEDNARTLEALHRMGVRAEIRGSALSVEGGGLGGLRPPDTPIDCGNSGTTMRLLAGLCAAMPDARVVLDGDASLRRRPMRRVADPLGRMGARVTGRGEGGDLLPPIEIHGAALRGIDADLRVASAQVKSALLLAGLRARGATRVREPGASRDHTERMLREQGAPLRARAGVVEVDPDGWDGRLGVLRMTVPGDLSSAAFVLVAALLIPGSDVVARGVGLNPTRTGALDVLRAMGADLEVEVAGEEGGEPVGDVRARASRLRACTIAGEHALRALDEIPILAVAATRAEGTTLIRDAAELRHKESDRLATMARLLRALGADIEETADGLSIRGPTDLSGATTSVGADLLDHRVAMSLAVAGLVSRDAVRVDAGATIATSFPGFVETLAGLGGSLAAVV